MQKKIIIGIIVIVILAAGGVYYFIQKNISPAPVGQTKIQTFSILGQVTSVAQDSIVINATKSVTDATGTRIQNVSMTVKTTSQTSFLRLTSKVGQKPVTTVPAKLSDIKQGSSVIVSTNDNIDSTTITMFTATKIGILQ